MKFRQLEYYVQIVESGSMAQAARRLHVVQPALSQQLASLEYEIGKKLLTRSSKGVTMTSNGAALYQHAKFVLRQMEQAAKIARADAGDIAGVVAIGLVPSTIAAVGLELVSEFRVKFPGITLKIVEALGGQLDQLLQTNQIDFTVRFTSATTKGFESSFLLEEELFVLVSGDSQLVLPKRASITLSEAAELPLILTTTSHGLRPLITREMERKGLTIAPVIESDSLALLIECVASNLGATILPMSALQFERAGKPLRAIRISGEKITRKNYLCSQSEDRLSACALLAREELRQLITRLARSGQWRGVTLPNELDVSGSEALL